MGVVVESMGIHPAPNTPKTDSGAGKTGTELGWCEHRLSGVGERDGKPWGDRPEYKNKG